MPRSSALAPVVSELPRSGSFTSELPPQASCLESASPSFSLTQEAAEALLRAAEAKAAVLACQAQLEDALAALDQMVAAGRLAEKGLPVVGGFTIYRSEGRASWSYPPHIKEMEAQVKQQKQLCEQLGEATQKRGNPFWTLKLEAS